MRIGYRRALYLGCFILFFGIGPLIIFYSIGLRYNPHTRKVSKVGVFYVKSYPANSPIFLDGKDTHKRTPNRLFNITPGEHVVAIERDGFFTWQKKLVVESGQTNFIRDVVLFKKDPVRTVLSTGGRNALSSDDGLLYIFLDSQSTIHLTNMDSGKDFFIKPQPRPDNLLALSPTSEQLLYSAKKQLYVLNINNEKNFHVVVPTATLTKAVWDPLFSNTLWILAGRSLGTFNLLDSTRTAYYSSVDDFIASSRYLCTLTLLNEQSRIQCYDANSRERTLDTLLQTESPAKLVAFSESGTLTLLSGKRILLIPADTQQKTATLDAVYYAWHDTRLLYANDFEINFYNEFEGSELIDRTSDRLRSIQWHPSGSYFLRQSNDSLQLVEMDGRGSRNVISLVSVTTTPQVFFDRRGSRMFVVTSTTNEFYDIQ